MVDVQVIGTGAAELAAALELAEVGLRIRVSPAPGDDEAWAALPSSGVADPDSALRGFLAHVAAPLAEGGPGVPAADPVESPIKPVLLRSSRGEWVPQPTPEVLGIPAVPMSADTLAVLGGGASTRAYLDRVKPLLTIGKTRSVGALVQSRMGKGALERLVEPIVRERYGVSAADVDMAIAAPGLNEDLTVIGTLSGAVLAYAERDVARETHVRPAGGWAALREALLARLALYEVEFTEQPVVDARHAVEGWTIVSERGVEGTVGALVVGVDPFGGELPGLAGDLGELSPRSARLRVRAAIEDPGLPEMDPARDALDALEVADTGGTGAPWSVRLGSDGAGGWFAEATSAATPYAAPTAGAVQGRHATARELEWATAAIGHAEARLSGAGLDSHRAVAPYVTTEERDAEASRLAVWRAARDETLPVGPALHGGDLAAAIADARSAAIALRRRLTGIAD
ncbi:hypothetical protein JD292_08600 [Leucobacter sp. CSA2]|uniref:Protoporphyrinogen oxidase n=1 Tax=Leucobacter edaphi TaxID=2796472 RepID=A0A934UY67_9MICO|nr:hypothetical protein [Leucobacter edaphi]MBK0422133.1 hypothetical protein [Leucobacter edaphi]